jgi:transposase
MGADGAVVARLAEKFSEFRPHADERAWRFYLGSEARAYARESGCGMGAAVAVVAAAAGVSRATVTAGAGDLAEGAGPMPGRVRRAGAGRPRAEESQPGLGPALRGLLEAATRGDPVTAVTWTTLSLRELERELAARGFRCRKDAVARMLHEAGYSLQGMSRVLEGRQHPDRDAQFRHVNAMIAQFAAAGDPVVSVDAKKKELIGPFHRPGRSWRPAGDPVKVRDHDFPDRQLGKVTPYGACDIAANRGFVSVGTSHDTAAFAVNALRLWWRAEGALRYPGARRLLVTCDAGGSNACTSRLWKDQLAVLAAETGLEVAVCHFPPGTSKWNKTGHRLFCHITRTWKARPLMTRQDAVAGIAATTTYQGLKVTAVLDDGFYPDKVKVGGKRVKYLEEHVITRHGPHGEWNYTVRPAAPEPAPPPGPDLEALAALAGIAALPALLAAVAAPWQADRDRRRHLARGAPRTRNSGGTPWKLPFEAIVTAAACHHRLGMPYRLLSEVLGAHESTISQAVRRISPLLAPHGITPATAGPRITTLTRLREHATARGVTINGIPPQKPQNSDYRNDTPETAK